MTPRTTAAASTLAVALACSTPSSTPPSAAAPSPSSFTPAPLRNRVRLELAAPPAEVWALVGDLSRYPEYSGGLARVDVRRDASGRCTEYVCHFVPMAPGEEGASHREVMRWYEPGQGYVSEAEEPNAFGLSHSVTLVRLEPSGGGTTLTWTLNYDAADLPTSRAMFDEALADISARLVARFGGRVLERWVEGAAHPQR